MNKLLCAALLLVGPLARADLVEVAPDLYLLTRTGQLSKHVELKLDAIREATAFAKQKGKVAMPVSGREFPPTGPFTSATFEYQFRLVTPEEAQREKATLADVVISTTGRPAAPDLYSELIKLDVLRQRGLLTPQEFDLQKKRVIESQGSPLPLMPPAAD